MTWLIVELLIGLPLVAYFLALCTVAGRADDRWEE